MLFYPREVLKEDEKGSLQASVADVIHKAKRKQLLDRPVNVRLGMVSGQLMSCLLKINFAIQYMICHCASLR